MEAQRGGAVDIVIDAPGDSHNLDAEAFIDRTGSAKTAVASQDDHSAVFHVGVEVPHGGLLNLFLLEVFKAAAADWAARQAAHTTGIFLAHHLDPVVREPKEAVTNEAYFKSEAIPRHA